MRMLRFNKILWLFSLVLVFLITSTFADDKSSVNMKKANEDLKIADIWNSVKNGDTIRLYGIVRRLGNDPFSFIVITDQYNNDWNIADESLINYVFPEHEYMTIEAIVERKTMVLANGTIIGDRRILTVVKIFK